MGKKLKSNKGITMIALTVTIIVILILTGVSVEMIKGENGMIHKAIREKQEQKERILYEKIGLILLNSQSDMELRTYTQDEMRNKIAGEFQEDKLKATIQKRKDGYVIVYGEYRKSILYINPMLDIYKETPAIIGKREDWEYEHNSDLTITLIARKNKENKPIKGHFDIPNVIDGYLVTILGDDLFNQATGMTSMTLPIAIEKIGNRTFMNCTNLKWNVEFPETVISVGDRAFSGCENLTGNLDEIMNLEVQYGRGVFMGCTGLKGDVKNLVAMLKVEDTVIEAGFFSGFSGATGELVIPRRIKRIGDNAFYGCSSINKITFENGSQLQYIGNDAFGLCTGATGILEIPDTVEVIGDRAFKEDTKLTGLKLSNNLRELGEQAFYECGKMRGRVTFSSGLNEIKKETFTYSGIEELVFSTNANRGVGVIGHRAFEACYNLKKIELPETLIEIRQQAFYDNTSLGNLKLPNGLKNIFGGAFSHDRNLDIIYWPNSLEKIDYGVFNDCSNLKELPNFEKLTFIGSEAFKSCTLIGTRNGNNIIEKLQNSIIDRIDNAAFFGCKLLTGSYDETLNNKLGRQIIINGSPFIETSVTKSKTFDLEGRDTILYSEYAGVNELRDMNGNVIKNLVIPKSVKKIETYAFSGCSAIESIEIPDSVEKIGGGAFSNAVNLKSIRLPQNSMYTVMESQMLNGCKNLKNLEIPNNVNKIKSWAISDTAILELIVPGNVKVIEGSGLANNLEMKKLIIQEGVQALGSQFIRQTKITELIIPNSVTTIESAALHYCPNLKRVRIGKGVTKLPNSLTWASSNIEEIKIDGNVTHIGEKAFENLYFLKKIEVPKNWWYGIQNIGYKAFYNCKNLVGEGVLNPMCSIGERAFELTPGLKLSK